MMQRFLSSAAIIAAFIPAAAFAQGLTLPANDGYVTDATTRGVLSLEQDHALEKTIADFRDATGNEIAIIILEDLGGMDPSEAGVEIGRRWGVGDAEKNNGIVILVDYASSKVFMSVGSGLEGALPDIATKGIVDNDIVPNFREARFYEGLEAAVESITKHIAGEYGAERYQEPAQSSLMIWFIVAFFLLMQWLLAILGRTKSWWPGGALGGIGGIFLSVGYGWWLTIPFLVVLGLGLDFIVARAYRTRGPTPWWAGGNWGPGRRFRPRRPRTGGGSSGGGGAGGRF